MKTVGPAVTLAGGARGVEVYTRVSLYSFVLLEPFFFLFAVPALADPDTERLGTGAALILLAAALAHMCACFATVHVGFDRPLTIGGRPRPVVRVLLAATVVLLVVSVLVLPPDGGAGGIADDPRTVLLGVGGAATVGALAVAVPVRRVALVAVGVPVVVVAVRAAADASTGLLTLGVSAYVLTMFWAGTMRLSMWVVEVVRRLDETREVAARLAVAEERLRISRDMHDVVGRALSAVAVKSELAAALARRGDARGADEMDEVRTLAQDSLREVRSVVAGYRAADLATELDGARSVLRAAGVAVRVMGEIPELGARQVDALAWVVRESVTNIVRHSAARECRIDLTRSDAKREMVLTVSNDGVRTGHREMAVPAGGSGLAGLRERLTTVGGVLGVEADGDRFVLTARVPASTGVAS